jgi:hypothetical protein
MGPQARIPARSTQTIQAQPLMGRGSRRAASAASLAMAAPRSRRLRLMKQPRAASQA